MLEVDTTTAFPASIHYCLCIPAVTFHVFAFDELEEFYYVNTSTIAVQLESACRKDYI